MFFFLGAQGVLRFSLSYRRVHNRAVPPIDSSAGAIIFIFFPNDAKARDASNALPPSSAISLRAREAEEICARKRGEGLRVG